MGSLAGEGYLVTDLDKNSKNKDFSTCVEIRKKHKPGAAAVEIKSCSTQKCGTRTTFKCVSDGVELFSEMDVDFCIFCLHGKIKGAFEMWIVSRKSLKSNEFFERRSLQREYEVWRDVMSEYRVDSVVPAFAKYFGYD